MRVLLLLAALVVATVCAKTRTTTVWKGGDKKSTRVTTVTRNAVRATTRTKTLNATITVHSVAVAVSSALRTATATVTRTGEPKRVTKTTQALRTVTHSDRDLEEMAEWVRRVGSRAVAPTRLACGLGKIRLTTHTLTVEATVTLHTPVVAVPMATSVATYVAYSAAEAHV